jgi:tRNA pseudouridine38-40 synthase
MRNLKLVLSYDGTDFYGWQTQLGYRTVQETLEKAITDLTGEERIRVNASSRTDTGVHAVGQVVNLSSATRLAPDVLVRALNAHLPPDVVVREAADVPPDFDANRHARRKLYRYVIHDGPVPDLFLRRYYCPSRHRLDVDAMRRAAVTASTWTPCGGPQNRSWVGTIFAASRRIGPTDGRASVP